MHKSFSACPLSSIYNSIYGTSSSFDNKVYEILKNGGSGGGGGEEEEEEEEDIPDPSPDVDFDDVFPIGAVVICKSSECPFSPGTWQLTGLYGIATLNSLHTISFNKDHAICNTIIDASGSTQWSINFNDSFGDCTIKYLLGPSYRSPQSSSSADAYNRFYDDKNGWYAIINGSQLTVKGAGLADRTRKYELSVLIQMNSFDQVVKTFEHYDISYEFTRTA